MSGRLIGIALRPARKAPMEPRAEAAISVETGLDGDHAGADPARLVTVLSAEGWREACADIVPPLEEEEALDWTTRRANLLIENARLPRAAGGVFRVGRAVLEVTGQTWPCARMEEARKGLLKALAKDWRGGVTCAVREGGVVKLGDEVDVLVSPPEISRRLP